MKSKGIVIALTIIVLIVLAIIGAKAYIETNLENLTVSNIDLSKVEDGIYAGSYMAFPVAAEVRATVSNHRLTKIDLVKHTNGQGMAAEVITDKVIEAQTLEVDIVSGATYSSKVILNAIADALSK